ncbi:hypothetical protein [Kribbella sp. NPDC051770]|uniref:hypothetical protein n=1 Tax=Kribbella sp. NPDC051770 TaxID=3155413 RepID=UPI003419E188
MALPFDGGEYDRLNVTPDRTGLADGEPLVRVRLPHGPDGWLARRYADVRAVLSDPRFSRTRQLSTPNVPRLRARGRARGRHQPVRLPRRSGRAAAREAG